VHISEHEDHPFSLEEDHHFGACGPPFRLKGTTDLVFFRKGGPHAPETKHRQITLVTKSCQTEVLNKEEFVAAERLAMKSVKRLIELRFGGLSQRQTAKALGCGKTTVVRYDRLIEKSGIQSYAEVSNLSEVELLSKLGLESYLPTNSKNRRPLPNWSEVYQESKRNM
jgi:hypothetical protein